MRHFISAFILATCSLLPKNMCGQLQSLKAGDAFPDIVFNNVYNYSKSELKLSELRPKLVILDFWSTTCISCIKSFPKIEKLQQEFSNQIQVVMVTKESKAKVDSFLANRSKIKLPNVILLTSDTILNKAFPRATISLNVWIDKGGRISFITEGFETNTAQVKSFLRGDKIELTDFYGKPARTKTLFAKEAEKSLRYFSYISHYNRVNIGSDFDLDGVSISERGLSAVELFKIAFNERWKYGFHRPNRIILEIQDSFKYVRPVGAGGQLGEWIDKYCYNYQLFLPKEKAGEEYKIMQQDLLRYFDLDPRIEKRLVTALSLVRTDKVDRIATRGGNPNSSFVQNSISYNDMGSTRKVVNKPFSFFHNLLNGIIEYQLGIPILDDSNYSGNIDIEVAGSCLDNISNDFESLSCLQTELNKYGLKLVPTQTEIEVLVLRQR